MAMSVSDAAKRAGTSTSAIYAGIRRGTIKAVKKGRSWVVTSLGKTKKTTKSNNNNKNAGKKKMSKTTKAVGIGAGAIGAGVLANEYGSGVVSKSKLAYGKVKDASKNAYSKTKGAGKNTLTKLQNLKTKDLTSLPGKAVGNVKAKGKYIKDVAKGNTITNRQKKAIEKLYKNSHPAQKAELIESATRIRQVANKKAIKNLKKGAKKAGKYGAGLALLGGAAYGANKLYKRSKKKKAKKSK